MRASQYGRSETGALGEDLAATHLRARGCTLLARNLRIGRLEIDLVVRDGAQVAFVEVKTVRGRGFGAAFELVDRRKVQRLVRAIPHYLAAHPEVASVRLDVVTVERDGGAWHVAHVPGALP